MKKILDVVPDKTAVLIMDYQNKQLSGQPEETRNRLLKMPNAGSTSPTRVWIEIKEVAWIQA